MAPAINRLRLRTSVKSTSALFDRLTRPDDFEGDALDALKLAVEYHEKIGKDRTKVGESHTGKLEKAWRLLFEHHTSTLWEDGNEDRISSVVSLQKYDRKAKKWRRMYRRRKSGTARQSARRPAR